MRSPDFSSRRRITPRGGVGGPARLPLFLAGGLLLASLLGAVGVRRDLALTRRSESEARQAAREARERLRATRATLDPQADALAGRADLLRRSPPPRVLADLQALMPAAVRLEQATLGYSSEVDLELRVVARTARDYDAFLERLAGASAFRGASTGPENREGEVRALVRARYARPGLP